MTGTADTEAEEFRKIYKLDVVVIPTNKPMRPQGRRGPRLQDRAREVRRGRPRRSRSATRGASRCWSARSSVEKSEVVARLLKKQRRPAQRAQRQAARARGRDRRAGRAARARVTIATNMAGRGTDIILGGNPEMMAKHEVGPDAATLPMEARDRRAPSPPSGAGRRRLRARPARARSSADRRASTRRSSAPAACTSSAPSATSRGASTTSCAAAPAARATRASAASTCRSRTT